MNDLSRPSNWWVSFKGTKAWVHSHPKAPGAWYAEPGGPHTVSKQAILETRFSIRGLRAHSLLVAPAGNSCKPSLSAAVHSTTCSWRCTLEWLCCPEQAQCGMAGGFLGPPDLRGSNKGTIFFCRTYFSRGTLPTKKETVQRHYWGT